jgi:hypothetical protein
MNRRGLVGAIAALFAAPAAVIAAAPRHVTLWGDCVHDDTEVVQTLIYGAAGVQWRGVTVVRPDGTTVLADGVIPPGAFRLWNSIHVSERVPPRMFGNRFH